MASADEQILRALSARPDLADAAGGDWLQRAAIDFTSLGSHAVLSLLVTVIVGFLLLRKRHGAAAQLLLTCVGAALLGTGLKMFFDRARPDIVAHLVGVHTSSFPSGHALLSAAIYPTLGALLAREYPQPALRRYSVMVALMLALLIGMSRIYLGVHWPSDVLAGWCIGLLWARGCWLLAKATSGTG